MAVVLTVGFSGGLLSPDSVHDEASGSALLARIHSGIRLSDLVALRAVIEQGASREAAKPVVASAVVLPTSMLLLLMKA